MILSLRFYVSCNRLGAEPRWAVKEAAYKALHPSLPIFRTLHPDFQFSFHTFDLVPSTSAPSLRVLRPSSRLSKPTIEISTDAENPVISNEAGSGESNAPNGIDGEGETDEVETMDGVRMMVSVSHDAGVVVGMVVAIDEGISRLSQGS